MSKSMRDVQRLYNEATNIALAIVEVRAREVMQKHPTMHEFIMGMGGWLFVGTDGNNYTDDDLKYLEEFGRIFVEWDEYLHLTGFGMRFTVDGKVITQW